MSIWKQNSSGDLQLAGLLDDDMCARCIGVNMRERIVRATEQVGRSPGRRVHVRDALVALHDDERTVERVGLYYSANAVGRLSGTLVSGGVYALAPSAAIGLTHCLLASVLAVLCACMGMVLLKRAQACA